MADSLNRINTGLFPGTKKGAFHSICSGSYACGSGWRRCGSGWRRLLIYNRLFFAVTLSREALTGPDVRLFLLAGEQVETGRNVRPVFESPKQYLFGTQQAVFSVTRNIFGNAKQLARKGGGKLLRSRRFLPGTPCAETKFLTDGGFPTPFALNSMLWNRKNHPQNGEKEADLPK